jgi:hypothetical protein
VKRTASHKERFTSEANYSKQNCIGERVDEPEHRGQFSFYVRTGADGKEWPGGMIICCPGCKGVSALPFRKPSQWAKQPHDWHFDGNYDKPTLTPSIHHVGCWHGHLRSGAFTSC